MNIPSDAELSRTQALSRFVAQLRFEDLPDEVVSKVREIALHSWGVQLAASTLPWSRQVYGFVRSQAGRPESTVANYGLQTTAIDAAYANACFAHGFEFDDNHASTGIKGGCVAIPTALAVSQRQLNSGREFIVAVVAGFEVMLRVGLVANPALWRQGAHPTGSSGAFGAAAITGKLLGLDEQHLTHALGGAGAQRSGLNEIPTSGRGQLKRTFGAMAAAGGIRAALLAKHGITGPLTTLDGGSGFCRTFDVDEAAAEGLTQGLGSTWEIMNVQYKVYAQDGYIQPICEAIDVIRRRTPFATEDVESVVVGASQVAVEEIIGSIRDPREVTDAQFSANFSAALFLVTGGAGFREYTDENLRNPLIRDIAARTTLEVDAEIDVEHLRAKPRGAKVTISLKDGTRRQHTVHNMRDLSPEELSAKFRALSRVVLTDDQSERLQELVGTLEQVPNAGSIGPLLVGT